MTREEARTFLSGTKVYVEGKSKEIQEKLFSLGYDWIDKRKQVQYDGKPFLFIRKDSLISYSEDVVYFKKESTEREISADEILSIEVTEPYRPFKSQEECWEEMQKHQPFGYIKGKALKNIVFITEISTSSTHNEIYFSLSHTTSVYDAVCLFDSYTFSDGTPFGIKE